MKFVIADVAGSFAPIVYADLKGNDKYSIIIKDKLFPNPFRNKIAWLNLSLRANAQFTMPLKKYYYKKVFGKFPEDDICFYLGTSWYDKDLFLFLRKRYPKCKIVFHFHDTVDFKLKTIPKLDIDVLKQNVDLILTYNKNDADRYSFIYCPDMYSRIDEEKIIKYPPCDVVFIGAAKDRMTKIIQAFEKFEKAGKKCWFYILGAKESEKKHRDKIIYSDNPISFFEVISRQLSARAILEITQGGTQDATLRFWDAVMYNKLLFTDCTAVQNYSYFNNQFIDCFQDPSAINIDLLETDLSLVNYHYRNDISPIYILDGIEKILNGEKFVFI